MRRDRRQLHQVVHFYCQVWKNTSSIQVPEGSQKIFTVGLGGGSRRRPFSLLLSFNDLLVTIVSCSLKMMPKGILRSTKFPLLKHAEKGIAYFLWGGVLQANVAVAEDRVHENRALLSSTRHASLLHGAKWKYVRSQRRPNTLMISQGLCS
jgi:hypothetical protein